ncbi:MAG: hypothetical protein ACREWG_12645 [Gammaproteobacteria bacterium]
MDNRSNRNAILASLLMVMFTGCATPGPDQLADGCEPPRCREERVALSASYVVVDRYVRALASDEEESPAEETLHRRRIYRGGRMLWEGAGKSLTAQPRYHVSPQERFVLIEGDPLIFVDGVSGRAVQVNPYVVNENDKTVRDRLRFELWRGDASGILASNQGTYWKADGARKQHMAYLEIWLIRSNTGTRQRLDRTETPYAKDLRWVAEQRGRVH